MYTWERTGAFSKSFYQSVRCGHKTQAAPYITQNVKKHLKKALKLMKIANITTQYNNIYVIILKLAEN